MLKCRYALRLLRINTYYSSVATTLISAAVVAIHIAQLSNHDWATERNQIQFIYLPEWL